jgi:hypothetical protein
MKLTFCTFLYSHNALGVMLKAGGRLGEGRGG